MIPLLLPGDEVLVNPRAYHRRAPQIGDIVLARRPDQPAVTMVKRVSAVEADGRLILRGDSPSASTDSRTFGPVSFDLVQGKVTSKFG